MKQLFPLLLLFCTSHIFAQLADFENFPLAPESFLNGIDGSGGFSSDGIFLPNHYITAWESWNGWAISNTTDTTTPGSMNQYSAITGSGAASSSNYAVAFVAGESIIQLPNNSTGDHISNLMITNSTYTYLSMKDGDSFAKKFGGLTGDDPDFLLLTVKKYSNGGILSTDSVDFYLADYRFADNSQDYIIDDWTMLDLSSLHSPDSLSFTLTSSDSNQFGMNTPAYFCIDNVQQISGLSPVTTISSAALFTILPNPATDYIVLKNVQNSDAVCTIYNATGQLVYNNVISDQEKINLGHLAKGTYVVKVQDGERVSSQLLVKQ